MIDTPLKLSLSADIPDARLAQVTRDLERDLSRAGIQARPVEAPSVPGERGDPFTLGVLALALVTSGTVKAMIECFKAYLSRERALTIKLMHGDGTQVTAYRVDETTGAFFQLTGTAGCVTEDGSSGAGPGTCGNGRAILRANEVTVGPGGRDVYVVSQDNSSPYSKANGLALFHAVTGS